MIDNHPARKKKMSSATTDPDQPENESCPPDSYLTLAQPGTAEIKIQRSRFIGLASHAPDQAAARLLIAKHASHFHDSRHVCHAWRLGQPPRVAEIRNDDGEPSGTAGEPILAEIRKRHLTQVVVVVVRYFGGVKLGTGGLARAYGQAASEALAGATDRIVKLGRTFEVRFPYALQKTLQHLLQRHEGRIEQEDYQADVSWLIWLPHSQWRAFAQELAEASAGSVHLHEPGA